MKAVIVAFDRFTDVDVFLPWDLLNRVRFQDKEFSVRIVGPLAKHKSVCGLELPMHGGIEECSNADMVYFASGPGTRDLIKDEQFLKQVRLDPTRQVVCSMCSGALILAALGVLDGLSATTYPTAVEELRGFGVEVDTTKHLVTHGNIGTAAGCLAAVDLMGWAIERLFDKSVSQDVMASVLPVGRGQVCIY
ncbi:MAG: DJ-1/PfpI family protein [Pirellula sp.]|jgi:transcriptional regulator GlxA family with amidase domain